MVRFVCNIVEYTYLEKPIYITERDEYICDALFRYKSNKQYMKNHARKYLV